MSNRRHGGYKTLIPILNKLRVSSEKAKPTEYKNRNNATSITDFLNGTETQKRKTQGELVTKKSL